MHRQEAKLLAKKNNVPRESLDAQVVETYHQHDRELSNQESRRVFEANRPTLDGAQEQVLEGLRSEGIAVTSFSTLVGDDALWSRLEADSAAFVAGAPERLARPSDQDAQAEEISQEIAKLQAKGGKPDKLAKLQAKLAKVQAGPRKDTYIVRQFAETPEKVLGSPWLDFATSPRILDVINSYLGLCVKVRYIDEWYTAVSDSEAERITSQRWHRDNDDQYLVKAFLYMNDVDEGSGPFQYVPGSGLSGPYSGEWPWAPLGEMYPPQDQFHDRIPESAVRTLTGPKGTLLLVNSSGFHRGGFATENIRVMSIITYVSPAALASIVEKGFQADVGTLPPNTPEAVKYALA